MSALAKMFVFVCISIFAAASAIAQLAPGVIEVISPEEAAPTIVIPETFKDAGEFIIAKTPSKFYFTAIEGCGPFPADNRGLWSSWSESIIASDGNYYTAISDHRGVDGRCFVTRFNFKTGKQDIVLDTDKLFNHVPGTFGHGKLHGHLDEYPEGFLNLGTYCGLLPLDTKYKGELWTGHIPGGRIARIDIKTGVSKDLGEAFARDSWPMTGTDTQRGIFFAIGYDKHLLAYNLKKEKVIFAGMPPANINWYPRCTLIDETTGLCYGTSRGRFVKFDAKKKQFSFLPCVTPRKTTKPGREPDPYELRAYTRRRVDGEYFPCVTVGGMLFKFYPDDERIERIGPNWGDGFYSTSMALSPKSRYLYYAVDVHGHAFRHSSPIVQYDLLENKRKVIAFLAPFFKDRFGYDIGGSFSIITNEDGSRLYITWNSKFSKGSGNIGEAFGNPTIMIIEIPASERPE